MPAHAESGRLGEAASHRGGVTRWQLNAGIALALDEATKPWGIRVFRYEIADIHVDRGTREAMEKQVRL